MKWFLLLMVRKRHLYSNISIELCNWLLQDRDERGLNYINQGDWCDPMNMVGYKGKGVSGWLTIATAYACMIWADICERSGRRTLAREFDWLLKKRMI